MITDEDVKRLTTDIMNTYVKHLQIQPDETLPTQIFRGVAMYKWENQHPGACRRHFEVFNKFNAIPKYCFNCFKVVIKPRNVIELLKILMVFEWLELPNNNTRKCLVEARDQVVGTYTALVYCIGIEEVLNIFKIVEKAVMEEISNDVPVSIKRGCTEFDIAHPGYAQVVDGQTSMDYNEDWMEYEEIVDKDYVVDTRGEQLESHDDPTYTMRDAKAVLAWLTYAATIGDTSYLYLTNGNPLPPFPDIKRPAFHSAPL